MDGRSGIEPPLRSRFSRQACRIEEDAARDDSVLQGIDVPFRATTRSLDVFHRNSVIPLSLGHDVTVHGIKMAVDHAMVCARILIPIGCSCWTDIAEKTLQYVRRIHGLFLS